MTLSASPDAVLDVSHLRISFSQYERGLRRRAVMPVVDMSLDVREREVVAVIGASGAGKSLIGLAVMGLLPPNASESGQVSFQGRRVDPAERRALAGRGMALLPQSATHLDPLTRVGAQVRRAARLSGAADPDAVAREALDRRGLGAGIERRFPHELSGGMARRVLFAMATLGEPELIFADEPTPGLDPAGAAEVIAAIRALADAGSAVILVSHDIELALPIADRVVVCRRGRTLETATPDQFSGGGERLTHPYARELWRALPQNGFAVPPRRSSVSGLGDVA